MKNMYYHLAVIFCTALVFASCIKEEFERDEVSHPQEEIITIGVGIESEEDSTKIAISDDQVYNVIRTAWQSGDKLRITAISTDAETETVEKEFTINSGFKRHHASFTGTKPEVNNLSGYTIHYPSNLLYEEINATVFSGRTQTANNNTDHLLYCVQLSGLKSLPNNSNILLTSKYAKENGYTLKRGSVLKFRLKLPEDATSVTRLELVASEVSGKGASSARIFYSSNDAASKTNTLTLNLKSVKPASQVLTAYMAIPWHGYSVAKNQQLTIKVTANGITYSKSFTPGAQTFSGGTAITYQLDMTKGTTSGTATEDGSASYPYQLSTVDDLLNISGRLKDSETVYFKLMNDIDMSGIDWTPINNIGTTYNRYIDFNGNGKLIKNFTCKDKLYASFFGVFQGKCYDVGFVNANVKGSELNHTVAIIAAYLGQRTPKSANQIGLIERCYTTGVVKSTDFYGAGLVGILGGAYNDSNRNIIRDCYSTALIEGRGAGLVSSSIKNGLIENCYFGGVLNATNITGGLIGHKDTYFNENATADYVTNCAQMARAIYSQDNLYYYCKDQEDATKISMNGNVAWEGTKFSTLSGEAANCATSTLAAIQTKFNNIDTRDAWHNTTYGDGTYPLLEWQVTRGDYNTYSGHKDSYFSGGNGTEGSPYIIDKQYQLFEIHRNSPINGTTYFKLNSDLDLSRLQKWDPINVGDSNKRKIILDGGSKTLSNLTIDSANNTAAYQGFFTILYGELKNITLKDFNVTQRRKETAGIVTGYLSNSNANNPLSASLSSVYVVGGSLKSVEPTDETDALGGICGAAGFSVTMTDCSCSATITGAAVGGITECGGLIGKIPTDKSPTLNNCRFTGKLTNPDYYTGGLIGRIASNADNVSLTGCYTTNATITGNGYVGGLIGMHSVGDLTISKCYCTKSTITNNANNVGGLIAHATADNHTATFTDSYVQDCTISGGARVGGLIGIHEAGTLNITGCYCNKKEKTMSIKGTGEGIGGLIGTAETSASLSSSYVEGASISGPTKIGGLIGNQHTGTLTMNKCSFKSSTLTNTGHYTGGLIGIIESSSSATNLSNVCSTESSTISGPGYVGGFIGFHSNGNLTINGCKCIKSTITTTTNTVGGLIAHATADNHAATLTNSFVEDCTISGGSRVGGLIGIHDAGTLKITGCYCQKNTGTMSVKGTETDNDETIASVGGLIGTCGSATLSTSYIKNAKITGTQRVGGLVGYQNSGTLTMTGCYNNATHVDGSAAFIGGLLGYSAGTTAKLSQCYTKASNITGYGRVGGLVGKLASGTLTISESYYSGDQNGTNGTVKTMGGDGVNYVVGGILGENYEGSTTAINENTSSTYNTVIENCYSRGYIDCRSQSAGGIVGVARKGAIVRFCISDCKIQTHRCGGGIVGNASNGGSTFNDGGVMVKHCICWSPSIVGTSKNGNYYSCGAIIGFTAKDNILFHCWYNRDMVLEGPDSKIANPINILVEQNRYGGFNVSDALWNSWGGEGVYNTTSEKNAIRRDPMVPGTTLGTSNSGEYSYINPYHGGMVDRDNYSARMIANNTHFDKTIWDLHGTYDANYIMPKLKNNTEQ